jgi:hypothetical protein
VEVSIDLEAPISIPLSLGWFTLPVFGIDEVPSLIVLSGSWLLISKVDISILSINLAINFHYSLCVLSNEEEWIRPSEELEPSGVVGSASQVGSFQ